MPEKPLRVAVSVLVTVLFALGFAYYWAINKERLSRPAPPQYTFEELQQKTYELLDKVEPARALTGVLRKIEPGKLTVVFDREMFGVRVVRVYYVKAAAAAPVTVNGRSASLSDLKIGDNLVVSIAEGLDPNPRNPQNYTAVKIEAKR